MRQQQPIFQVSDLANELRRLIETSYPEIWIEGELSSLSTPASGHLYFSLKDEKAQLRCAMFKGRASISKYKAKAGDLVRVRAKLSMYTARGDLQCIVQHIEEAGEGLLQRRYEELKDKLNALGLFDQNRKRKIPQFPTHIGIITSPSGAAIQDILSTLARRCPGIPVTIYPAIVQGDNAAASLIQAIDDALRHAQADVLILSRGGGSLEDLWCFNNEQLAKTIAACELPIVSGVGHEVDVTIADLVSDLRAPTPTAAAELLSPNRVQIIEQVNSLAQRMKHSFSRFCQQSAQGVDFTSKQLVHPRRQLQNNRHALKTLAPRLMRACTGNTTNKQNLIDDKLRRLSFCNPSQAIREQDKQLKILAKRQHTAVNGKLSTMQLNIKNQAARINTVNPLATLERGYSITRSGNNSILRSTRNLAPNDEIDVELSDGHLLCRIKAVQT